MQANLYTYTYIGVTKPNATEPHTCIEVTIPIYRAKLWFRPIWLQILQANLYLYRVTKPNAGKPHTYTYIEGD